MQSFLHDRNSDEADADLSRYRRCGAGELGFSLSEFRELLEDIVYHSFPKDCSHQTREKFLDGLRIEDLLLARACARGLDGAWDRFLMLYREKLRFAARAIARDESIARELADSLYAELFGMRVEGDGRRVSKLNFYTGRGSLDGWLKTVLAQNYVNRHRGQRKFVSLDDSNDVDLTGAANRSSSPSDQAKLAAATDAVLTELSAEGQFVLAAYHLDGRSLAEIGRMLGVHESTVSRRIEKTTSALRKRIVKELGRSGVSKERANEMLEMDVRELELDVAKSLAQGRRGESFSR